MSFFDDILTKAGNWLEDHPAVGMGAPAALGLGLPAAGAGLGFGAAEAGAAAGGGEVLGFGASEEAMGLSAPSGFGADPGIQAIESAVKPGGGAAFSDPFSINVPGEGGLADAASSAGGMGAEKPGFMSGLWGSAKSQVMKNPLGTAAAGAGLGMNILRGNPNDPNRDKLQSTADQLGSQGQVLQQYLANGTLPPAMKAQMDQATAAAKARIVSNHARNGMPTDPSQNSALAQELNAVDLNAVAAMGQVQLDMMKTGLSETGLSSQLYEMLVKMDRQNNNDLMTAISNFASALGGGGKGVQLKLA